MHKGFAFILSLATSLVLSSNVVHGQGAGGSALTSFGYHLPPSAVTAAPGQILMISVSGSRTRLSAPQTAIVDGAGHFPTQLAGFTISLLQSQQPKQVEAHPIGIQQSACTDSLCEPITSITLQVPMELQAPSNTASLLVRDTGGTLIVIPLNAVTDRVHVLNSCDQTLWSKVCLPISRTQDVLPR